MNKRKVHQMPPFIHIKSASPMSQAEVNNIKEALLKSMKTNHPVVLRTDEDCEIKWITPISPKRNRFLNRPKLLKVKR